MKHNAKSIILLLSFILLSFNVRAADVTVNGSVTWTDASGGIHPSRFVRVQLWDRETYPNSPRLLRTVSTGANGRYSVTLPNNDGLTGGGIDLFVKVASFNLIFKLAAGQGAAFQFYEINSADYNNLADNSTTTINFNAAGQTSKAFSIIDALIEGVIHARKLNLAHGTSTGVRYLKAYFPAGRTEYVPKISQINIAAIDGFKWDDILHEYGHHIAHRNKIELTPGVHWLDVNLTRSHGKDIGNRLALSEGFATFFSIITQQKELTAKLRVPGTGDQLWSQRLHVEKNNDVASYSQNGEDNEVAIARILWDIMDKVSDDQESIVLGEKSIYQKLKGAATISDFWNNITKGLPLKKKLPYAWVYELHGVSPKSSAKYSGNILGAGNILRWKAQGTKNAYHLNSFTLLFTDLGINQIVHRIKVNPARTAACAQNGPIANNPFCEYTLTQKDVLLINAALLKRGYKVGSAKWIVEGASDNRVPVTGKYLGQPLELHGESDDSSTQIGHVYIHPEKYRELVTYLEEVSVIEMWNNFYNIHYSERYDGIIAYDKNEQLVLIHKMSRISLETPPYRNIRRR